VDISGAAIDGAGSAHRHVVGLEFAVVDVTRRGVLDRQFDAAVDRGCLHGLPPKLQGRYAANLKRWVRPSGALVLTMHTGGNLSVDVRRRQVVRLLSPEFAVADTIDDVVVGMVGGGALSGVTFYLVRR
jgi:hypothetical protein